MTICRYYIQGICRFGDRCRNEHIDANYDSYNYYSQNNAGNYQERYDTRQANYRSDNQYANQRYGQSNYYAGSQRSYSPDRYSENYRQDSARYSYAYDNQYQSQPRYESQPRYNDQNYGRSQQYSPINYQNENAYGQNRFQWVSENYKKQTHQNVEQSRNDYVNDTYNTSTPKGKVSFSFKVPESEIKKTTSSVYQISEQDQLHVELVKEEVKAWEFGGQWPFTCYFPSYKHGFPGFYDVSPEELRDIAYKSKKNNTYESYVKGVEIALAQVNELRNQLQIPTPQLLSILKQIRDGKDLYSASPKIDPIATIQNNETTDENMGTPAMSAFANSAGSFSFKILTETDSSDRSSAVNFSFRLPVGTEIKAITPVSEGDLDVYSCMEKLTEEEKKQFFASTFVLGKIPSKPPPQTLCT